jgi:hypothetical protein
MEIKGVLAKAFRREFPQDTVDISDGYAENIHVLVVSRRFDGMSEQDKLDWLWGIIDSANLRAAEKALISVLLPVSPAEIK